MVSNIASLSAMKSAELELRIYKSIGVPQFRDLLFRIEKVRRHQSGELNHNYHLKTTSWKSIQIYVAYLIYNSLIHVIALFMALICIALTVIYDSKLYVVYAILACLVFFNIWCLLLQRYNYLRIKILQLKVESKQKAKKMKAANKIIQCFPENYCIEHIQSDGGLIKRILSSISNKKDILICKNDCESIERMSLLIMTANELQNTNNIHCCPGNADHINAPISNLLDADSFSISPYNKVDWRVDRLLRFAGALPLLPIAAIITADEQTEQAYRVLMKCSSPWTIVEELEILDLVFSTKLSEL